MGECMQSVHSSACVYYEGCTSFSTTIVCEHSVGSLISLCSVNSVQACKVALCKPDKCQGMSFMFQPISFHVSGLVASTSATHININNPEQRVQYNAKDCTFTTVVVFAF